jgi:uncharacterized membrane protein YkgB
MEGTVNYFVDLLSRSGLLKPDREYHMLRAAMVIIFAWFGYDKWFEDEIKGLLPIITHGPFIFWTIPVLGIRGTAVFLGTSEWTFGTLLFLGFWSKKLGMLGALGSTFTFVATFTCRRWLPSHDCDFGLPPKGPSLAGCLLVPAEARSCPGDRKQTLCHGERLIGWETCL